uniref:Sulfotransferase n=1 Tax=Triticum urartu TaxID=4572 RepID=A0A8R7P8R5_TRIUA
MVCRPGANGLHNGRGRMLLGVSLGHCHCHNCEVRHNVDKSNALLHGAQKRAPRRRNRILEYQLYIRNRIPNLDGLPDPRLFAAHAPLVSLPRSVMRMGCKIVYVCRDPKDVLISHWNFVNKFRARDGLEALSVETAADFFCDGVTLSGPYWDHVLGYWRAHQAHPQKVLFFRYEEMIGDPAAHVRKLAQFVGRPFCMEEEEAGAVEAIVRLCSFEHMTGLDVAKHGVTELVVSMAENSWFFRRGQVGDWGNYLSRETARRIDAITEARFKGSGLRV